MKVFSFFSGTAAALALVTGLAAAQPAAARDRMSPGAAAAVGALGGLAVGTIVGATIAQQPAYAAPAPVYVAPPPPPPPTRVYVEQPGTVVYEHHRPRRVYVERCTTERYREWVPGWGWEYRSRQVCN
ncbi:hypothetical protein DC522_12335 [Microvirga sp. KLBC 81]|uniref:hypothetical protein n=1 Tax=Microvirga sp. KLBC 81 TaxID=1862707 RepID=UPI000D50BAF8|nr:hypothetical protein [Microvirga sp. KLBC 81]PVE24080.1 hypothetical protein DC522_12335 [Microvirga sp. KLBC 81]